MMITIIIDNYDTTTTYDNVDGNTKYYCYSYV